MCSINEILPMLSTADVQTLEKVRGVLTNTLKTSPAEMDVRTITQSEAAKRLCVGRATIARLMKKGVFVTIPLDGVERINLQSFLDYATGGGRNRAGRVMA